MIVTGASRGIGRAVALALAGQGAHVVVNATSPTPLEQTRDQCREAGVQAEAVPGDIADAATADTLMRMAHRMGNVYGFVHAAGVLHPGPLLWELEPQDFAGVFGASVTGAYQLVRACVPELKKKGEGVAVFFGSGAAEMAQPGIAAYCAAKAAEESLARQLAEEAPEIATIVFRPGIVETRMQEQARNATGGGAENLHTVFRAWKEQDALLEPEESAEDLLSLLQEPRRHHGTMRRARDRR
jgi:NAD(P)-dependent dehydrogenase (short-subunit alcohol dehydrogenase family)